MAEALTLTPLPCRGRPLLLSGRVLRGGAGSMARAKPFDGESPSWRHERNCETAFPFANPPTKPLKSLAALPACAHVRAGAPALRPGHHSLALARVLPARHAALGHGPAASERRAAPHSRQMGES